MSEEQHGGNQNIRPSILSSVISSGSGSSISPLSSLRATGQAAASAAQGIYLQPQAERDNESHSDSANPTCTPFVQQVQTNPVYGSMVHAISEYEVRLVHGKKQLHWFLLVKMFRSKLAYLTLEISTTDLHDLIPILRSVVSENNYENFAPEVEDPSLATCITDTGTYKGTLHDLCQLADKVVEEMRNYNLVTSNCQHFCNNLLRKIGKKTYPMTIGRMASEIKEKKFDYYSNVISNNVPPLVHLNN